MACSKYLVAFLVLLLSTIVTRNTASETKSVVCPVKQQSPGPLPSGFSAQKAFAVSLCDTGTPAACRDKGMSPCQSKQSPHLPPPHFGNSPEELLNPHTQPLLLGLTHPHAELLCLSVPHADLRGGLSAGGRLVGSPRLAVPDPTPSFSPRLRPGLLIHSWDEPVQCCSASCCYCTQQGDSLAAESSSPAACSCVCHMAVALLALSTLWVQVA